MLEKRHFVLGSVCRVSGTRVTILKSSCTKIDDYLNIVYFSKPQQIQFSGTACAPR